MSMTSFLGHSPAIILVSPQMGENIGAAARVMSNFGLVDLRLVTPRDGWPNPKAIEMARHGGHIINNVTIYNNLKEAVADLQVLYATTARPRHMVKPVVTPSKCGGLLKEAAGQGQKPGIIFGPEKTGLSNDDIVLADAVVAVPVSEVNPSLNLAQAIAILAYEWFKAGDDTADITIDTGQSPLATKNELNSFLAILEEELDKKGFFPTKELKPGMLRNLNNIFTRGNLTSQEVRTLRGVINSLCHHKGIKNQEN